MTSSAKLNLISLFAGGGGVSHGLEQAGFTILLASDVEPSAAATFGKNKPSTPFLLKDARHLTRADVTGVEGPVHLVSAGLPCQGFSTLGDQVSSDVRNQLFRALLRVVDWTSAESVLVENVNYLRSQYGGRYEHAIKAALQERGFNVHVAVLDAADYGVPQHRKRVFFFATRREGFAWPETTHGEGLGLRPHVTAWDAIGDLALADAAKVRNHDALRHSDRVVRRYALIPEGGRMPPPAELPPDIRRRNFGNTYKRLSRHKPSLTLVPGNNAFPVHPTLHRSLTPREAARLQSFPDDYEFAGNRAEQCRLVGNAVPPALAKALGEAIKRHLLAEPRPASRRVIVSPAPQIELARGAHRQAPTAVSFFTGLGGMMLGFMNAGFRVLASYDRKRIVAENLAANFPSLQHHSCDVSALTAAELAAHVGGKAVDVVFGGSPCQGFSIFGQRRFANTCGHELDKDERNELTIKYVDLAISLSPKVIVLENVKGMLSARRGASSYLIQVTSALADAGYEVSYKVLMSADYGVPQARERLILVAWRPELTFRWPEKKYHAQPKPWQRPYVTVGDVITDLMDTSTEGQDFSHVPMQHKELVVERYKLIPEGGRLPEEALSEELSRGYRTTKVRNYSHVWRRLSMSAPATTMVPGHNAFPVHPRLNRTLTVREAARIQTFPDEVRVVGTRQQQCLLVGNAVPVLLAEVLAQSISKTLAGAYNDPGYKADIYELAAE